MVGGRHSRIFQGYRESSMRQDFNRLAGFQVALASGCTWELPGRGNVVDETIVEGFSDLMADRGHVFKSAAKDSRRNPACELSGPAVLRCTKIGEVGVEAKHAAAAALQGIVGIEREQERVG